jgi:pheromone shutdown protein TraB
VNPEVVFLELDPARAVQLRNRRDAGNNSGMDFSPFDLSKFLNGNPLFRGVQNNMANSPLSSSLEKILPVIPTFLKKLGWLPPQGGEMKAAMEEADRIGARCVYGDVDFTETISALKAAAFGLMASPTAMMQTFSNVPPPPPELSEIFSGLMGGSKDPQQLVEDIKTRERSKTMTRYMSRCFPSIYHVMITKRDEHMARQLKKHCHKGKVVAVVGMAHVEGIEREWEKLDNVKQIS